MTKPVYCTAPWNGITIRENGDVKTCCEGRTTLMNLNTHSIKDLESSKILISIREKMLNGEPDINCQGCVNRERTTGLATVRQHYNRHYLKIDQLKLQFIDVRWNNTCNLNCMYCDSTFSSTWEERARVLKQERSNPIKNYQDELLEWILQRADHVKEIMLVGGEPMLMKQNYALLAKLPIDCKISIITNMSYKLDQLPCLPDLLKRPPELITWNVSVENIGNKFEYVRNGSSWEQLKENFNFLQQHWPESVTLNMCYNLFSAFDMFETVKEFVGMNVKKFNIFPIHGNSEIDMFKMPVSLRQLASNQLKMTIEWHKNSLHPEDREFYPWVGAETLLNSLTNTINSEITLEQFNKKINWYDQWSKFKFADLWPETYQLIQSKLQ